ncbi:hypothetical protein THAOC_02219 [Thalassiosira oceanica]|uniref:Transcription initiation factor IIE subunit beta n=1 Tax=Thalassiosira oceanica TaxID=159749 RepID=K0TG61_THAOC|nr:hypothetical protein THAOC_02219 [Thalassiosira oceanica]|eukprot:EJK76039.1 hypothetical protein THAOC_02219 [Thalassiosira oceanica]
MSNSYGFDFLRSEHNLPSSDDADTLHPFASNVLNVKSSASSNVPRGVPDVSQKSDLEKQADVLVFLRNHRSAGFLPPAVIYKNLGIDLSDGGVDSAVVKMLECNPKVNVEEVPDPENPSLAMNTFSYRAKFSTVRDKPTLLAQINRMKNGVRWADLSDAYDGVEVDLQSLMTAGEVLAVGPEPKELVVFPRGESFLVELDGCVKLKEEVPPLPEEPTDKTDQQQMAVYKNRLAEYKNARKLQSCLIQTDIDPRLQIRRGEAIKIGGEWFRVSSAVRDDLPLDKQPPRAQAPPSVVSMKDLSKKNDADGYVRRFDAKTIPLDGPLEDDFGRANLDNAKAARARLHAIAGGGGGGTGARNLTGGASSTPLSSFASEKNAVTLAELFAQNVAASFGMGRMGGAPIRPGGRKRPTMMANRRGDGPGSKGKAVDPEEIKRAVDNAKEAASDPSLSYSRAVRHGCTKDVRDMYLETVSMIPTSDVELRQEDK